MIQSTSPLSYTFTSSKGKKKKVKNIIFLIGDGMGFPYITGLRYYNNPKTGFMKPTIFDPFFVGTQSTYSIDTECNITDSAAAGTALATGHKTYNGAIAVDINNNKVPSILELAKYQGKATGIVGTCQINHATLAAFAAHNTSRNEYDKIADDYLDDRINGKQKLDVMLGGGTSYFQREDRNLIEEFACQKYGIVSSLSELADNRNMQLLGLFSPIALPKMIDRDSSIPSLAQMTSAAIERLRQKEEGFFLLVEGSQIDWAAHDNDIVGAMSELKDFEAAFRVAISFALDRDDTLVIATADHSTGGMSIDCEERYNWNPSIIKSIHKTPSYIAQELHKTKDLTILEGSIDFILKDEDKLELESMLEREEEDISQTLIKIINKYSSTGWTSKGHTGEDVPVYASGPYADMFRGRLENADIAKILFELIS